MLMVVTVSVVLAMVTCPSACRSRRTGRSRDPCGWCSGRWWTASQDSSSLLITPIAVVAVGLLLGSDPRRDPAALPATRALGLPAGAVAAVDLGPVAHGESFLAGPFALPLLQ